jgi:hypothetical protein
MQAKTIEFTLPKLPHCVRCGRLAIGYAMERLAGLLDFDPEPACWKPCRPKWHAPSRQLRH